MFQACGYEAKSEWQEWSPQAEASNKVKDFHDNKWYPAYSGKVVCQIEIEGLGQVKMGGESGQSQTGDQTYGKVSISVFSTG